MKSKKIIVFKTGAIGDVIMTTPFLRALRRIFPDAQIDYWVGSWAKEALEGNKNINHIIPFDHNIFFKKRFLGLAKLLLKIKKQDYDMAFILDKHWFINYFMRSTQIPKRIGFDRAGEGKANTLNVKYGAVKHEIDYYLSLAYKVGVKKGKNRAKEVKLEIFLSEKDKKYAFDFIKKNKLKGKRIIGLAPAGGVNPGQKTEFRRWPKEDYISLCSSLLEKGFEIIFFGGKQDFFYNKQIQERLSKKTFNFSGKSVKQSVALMKYCRYFITNDSGTMHMASAADCKIISLFGATNPARKAPLNKGSKSIWKDKNIYEEDYEIYGRNPLKSKKFMEKIKKEDVLKLMK